MFPEERVNPKFFLIVVTVVSVITMVNILTSMRYLHTLFRISQAGPLAPSGPSLLNSTTELYQSQQENITATLEKVTEKPPPPLSPPPQPAEVSSTGPKASEKKKIELPATPKRAPFEGTARPLECNNCFKHDFNYVIQNESICSGGKDDVIDLLILVFTVHSNTNARQAIRNSWLSVAKGNRANVRYAFLLGETFNDSIRKVLRKESGDYGDLLMEDFKDHYLNLTLKTMMAFKWATTWCRKARFLLKTDDDMWVNIKSLLGLLKIHDRRLQTNVGGVCPSSESPIRDPRSKWHTSLQSYPQSSFPTFCSGTGYVTSMAVVEKVYKVSPSVPFFHLEDVYVALCVRRLGLGMVPLPGFHRYPTSHKPCDMQNPQIVTSHRVPPHVLLSAWNTKCT